ncbi:alpha/beta hydrolase [Herbaspirillum sp. ST 5-3]|uniref:alpha/beta fold hydrolase n=1 Tax=Oxalobacteraceae TaxID=75682 RepID=UPI0010A3190F|nr:alpha/beta hydrolase [Herbaspirillum sp. ST 5-3]
MLLNVQGQEAYCYTGGKPFNPELPTVVFIHGAQNDHSVWILQTRYFAHHGFGVLALDLPGHGRSKGAPLASVEAMADWLIALLDAAGVQKAALIGHSMGSLIALESAFRAPDRIGRLALVGTAYPMKVSDALLDASKNNEQMAIDMVNIWSHTSIAQKPSCPGPGFYVMNGSQRLMQHISRQNPAQVFYTDFSACNAYANGEVAAKSLASPALLVLGKRDMMTPPKATATLTKTIPQCRVVQIDNCGHSLMAEQPDAVLDALFGFMKE